jgi:hypothetical protein
MGCSKKNSPTPVIYYPDMTPFGIAIEIIKNNINLPDSILKKTKMSYYAFGVKNYLIDFAFAKDPIDTTKNLVGTYEAYQLSSISNRLTSISFPTIPGNYVTNLITVQVPAEPVSTYYIEYPNGLKTDTVYLVTTILQGLQAVNSACGCTDPVPQKIMFNGEPASLDTALTLKGGCINCRSNVYLLAK